MNSALIQSRIYSGYGKSARVLGDEYQFYRFISIDRVVQEDGSGIETEDGKGSIINETAPLTGPATNSVLDETGGQILSEDGSGPITGEQNISPPRTSANRILGENDDAILSEDGSGAISGEDSNAAPVTVGTLLNEDGTAIETEDGSGDLTGETSNTSPNHLQSPIKNSPYSTLYVSLNAEDMKYGKPNKYAKSTWYGLFDASGAVVGDYLIGPQGTFFIATLQPLLPILLVECNRVISLLTPQDQSGNGPQAYAGTTLANEQLVAAGWPASILQGTKGEKTAANLPSDTRAPWWVILLPAIANVVINFGDIITDDLGRRYIVSSAELTDLGWRITAMEAVS